jgi:hypothetical protein
MTRGPSEIINALRERYLRSPESPHDDPTIPWAFNQVLLPIILVLTFIILTEIHRYQEAHGRLLGALRAPRNEPSQRIIGQVTAINLQLQILLRKLEFEKAKERIDSKLTLFPDATLIRRSGLTLEDDNFKFLCAWAVPLLDEPGYREKVATMYRGILAKAEVLDPATPEQFERKQVFSEADLTAESVRALDDDEWLSVLNFDPHIIAERNRQILQNAILEFVDSLRTEIKAVQLSLLKTMLTELLENPEREVLSPQSRQLIEQMMKPGVSEQQRELLSRELYRKMLGEWAARCEKEGYPMPAWRNLAL